MRNQLELLRKNRKGSRELVQASPPSLKDLSEGNAFYYFVGLGGVGFTVSFIALYIMTHDLDQAFDTAKIIGFTCSVFYGVWPCLLWIVSYSQQKKVPEKALFSKLSPLHPLVCLLTVSFFVLYGLHYLYDYASYYTRIVEEAMQTPSHYRHAGHKISLERDNWSDTIEFIKQTHFDSLIGYYLKYYSFYALQWLILALFLHLLKEVGLKRLRKQEASFHVNKEDFRLWLGHSTGKLSKLSHGASLLANQKVSLSIEDAAQNILVLGGIGAGKTTGVMHPLLMQLLDQDCGGLIFDIKGDFKKAVQQFAKQTNRTITIIGPESNKTNLLEGLTPEVAASFLKSVFLLNGKPHGDSFWIETATELCRNTLGMLSFVPSSYHLQGLYRYLFDVKFRARIDEEIDAVLPILNDQQAKWLKAYCYYDEYIFNNFDAKVKAGVHATVAQILSPFNHPELTDTFCSVDEDKKIKEVEARAEETEKAQRKNRRMEEVLNGAIYLVDLPLATWGLGAKVVYSLIKLRFYNVMQQRAISPASTNTDKGKPVFFMCDEFQEIVSASKDGLSDLNFWDKSRSSKTIGIISAQAISSFYAGIGDRDIAHALLQNFRQKICFKTEDPATLDYFHQLTDKVEVIRGSFGKTRGTQSHSNAWGGRSSSSSSTENRSLIEKPVLSAQLFRQLELDQAIALLSIGGKSRDDVLRLMPVYI